MKQQLTSLFKFFVVTVIVIGVIWAWSQTRGCNKAKQTVSTIRQITRYDTANAHKWHDLYNQEHTTNGVLRASFRDFELMYGSKFDSLKKQLNIRNKQLQSLSEALVTAHGVVITTTVIDTLIDSSLTYTFAYSDDNTVIAGVAGKDSTVIRYSVDVPLSITTYWKRRWFLGRKHYYIDAYSRNSNITVDNIKHCEIK
jgi:hypothetical protein